MDVDAPVGPPHVEVISNGNIIVREDQDGREIAFPGGGAAEKPGKLLRRFCNAHARIPTGACSIAFTEPQDVNRSGTIRVLGVTLGSRTRR